MTLHLIDHIAFALFAAVFPIWDFFSLRKRAALINAGQTELRMKLYHQAIWQGWAIAIAVLGFWFALGRGGGAIGLVPGSGALVWAGYGLAIVVCALIVQQAWSIFRSPEKRAAMRDEFGSVSFLMPQTPKELRTFYGVSISAGICEEIMYRGFMIAYLMAFGMPFWVAGLVSSVAFGLAHAYQGPTGIVKTATVGGMMALLYGLTGSLWAPIVAHAVMDLAAGRLTYTVFNDTPKGRTGTVGRKFSLIISRIL